MESEEVKIEMIRRAIKQLMELDDEKFNPNRSSSLLECYAAVDSEDDKNTGGRRQLLSKLLSEASPLSEPSSGLPMKRVSRPARILQSPFVVDEGKVPKLPENVVVFEHYNCHADEADISSFQRWFQQGYKPRNKKKFNDVDDVISPPFLLGGHKIGNKTWFHELVNSECSLSSMHMDVCFYFIRQLTRHGENVKLKATTTDSWFQMKLKNIYSKFKQDPTILLSETMLIDLVTKGTSPLSSPWHCVDFVFMPIIPTNKAHWLLAVLEFSTHTLHVFNSAGKTYHDFLVRIGIEPYVKIIPYLLNSVGLWKRHIDYDGEDRMDLRLMVDSSLPQQSNGHDCGIFTIKYAEYLLHDDKDSMPSKFNAGRARLDIATRLYKHRSVAQRRR